MRFLTLDTLQCYGFVKRVDGMVTQRVCKNKVGAAQRAGGVSPPLGCETYGGSNGGLTPPARLRICPLACAMLKIPTIFLHTLTQRRSTQAIAIHNQIWYNAGWLLHSNLLSLRKYEPWYVFVCLPLLFVLSSIAHRCFTHRFPTKIGIES